MSGLAGRLTADSGKGHRHGETVDRNLHQRQVVDTDVAAGATARAQGQADRPAGHHSGAGEGRSGARVEGGVRGGQELVTGLGHAWVPSRVPIQLRDDRAAVAAGGQSRQVYGGHHDRRRPRDGAVAQDDRSRGVTGALRRHRGGPQDDRDHAEAAQHRRHQNPGAHRHGGTMATPSPGTHDIATPEPVTQGPVDATFPCECPLPNLAA